MGARSQLGYIIVRNGGQNTGIKGGREGRERERDGERERWREWESEMERAGSLIDWF